MAVYFMFTPSISAVITQKLIYRQSLMSLRLSLRPNGWFVVALLLPGTIVMASTATSLYQRRVGSDPAIRAEAFMAKELYHIGPAGLCFERKSICWLARPKTA